MEISANAKSKILDEKLVSALRDATPDSLLALSGDDAICMAMKTGEAATKQLLDDLGIAAIPEQLQEDDMGQAVFYPDAIKAAKLVALLEHVSVEAIEPRSRDAHVWQEQVNEARRGREAKPTLESPSGNGLSFMENHAVRGDLAREFSPSLVEHHLNVNVRKATDGSSMLTLEYHRKEPVPDELVQAMIKHAQDFARVKFDKKLAPDNAMQVRSGYSTEIAR